MSRRVLVVLDESRQAKVGDLAHQVVGHQDVSGSQVSVDVVHPLDEGHAVGDLRSGEMRGGGEKEEEEEKGRRRGRANQNQCSGRICETKKKTNQMLLQNQQARKLKRASVQLKDSLQSAAASPPLLSSAN